MNINNKLINLSEVARQLDVSDRYLRNRLGSQANVKLTEDEENKLREIFIDLFYDIFGDNASIFIDR